MLPSMPILFTSGSQDAFGNKVEPSTSFFSQNLFPKPSINPEPPPLVKVPDPPKVIPKETKGKSSAKKKDQTKKEPPPFNNKALELALVRAYYTKVQSRFSAHMNLPSNKFVQFQGILKSFDPSKETPVDLYKKIEQLFGDEHKDIVEEFLLYLKPGQAAEIGRFMDHFMLVQLFGFIRMLQSAFARKPTVLRKVLRALTAGVNSGSSQEMKNRVLPHLRSNPKLAQMFKSLFPDERPPDSVYETGFDTVGDNFLTDDKRYDVWELEETVDSKRKVEANSTLDTVYLQGRVFLQHGRLLRPAHVTFPYSKEPYRVHAKRLAPDFLNLSPSESDEERSSPKRQTKINSKIPPKRPRKQNKSPTKNVKDVNDNTNKDCVTSSPKTVRKQSNKSKVKEKKDDNKDSAQKKDKKEKTEPKYHACKKEEGTKNKQVKLGITPTADVKKEATKKENVKIETKKEVRFLIEDKTVIPSNDINPNSESKADLTYKNAKKEELDKEVMLNYKVNVNSEAKKEVASNKGINYKVDVNSEAKKEVANNEGINYKVDLISEAKKGVASNEGKKQDISGNWTREEDKTMLQVLKGEVVSEQVFGKINELLPHRSVTEIKERFCHVMTLLQQMAVGEVT